MNEIYTDLEELEELGEGGNVFKILLSHKWFPESVGKIEIIEGPMQHEYGWSYTVKDLDGKLTKYIKNQKK